MEDSGLVIAGVAVAMVTLLCVSTMRPIWGCILGATAIYNPVFNYEYLFIREFEGGSTRVTLSRAVVGCLGAGIACRRVLNRSSTRVNVRLPWQYAYVALALVAAAIGLLHDNPVRLVGSDLFPVVEFVAYFVLVGVAVRTREEAAWFCLALLVWGGIVAGIEIGLYGLREDQFVSHFALSGSSSIVRRLDDFIPSLLLPLTIALALHVASKPMKLLLLAISTLLATATLLSFFRSLWAGVATAIIVVLLVMTFSAGRTAWATHMAVIIIVGLVAALVLFVVSVVDLFPGMSAALLVSGRLAYIEDTSGAARLDDNQQLLTMLVQHPLGVGLGATVDRIPLFSWSNYYLTSAVELGIAGLVLMVLMATSFARINYVRYRVQADPTSRGLILGCLGSFTAMAITLFTFPSLLHYPIPAYLGLLAGLLTTLDPRVRVHGSDWTVLGHTEIVTSSVRVP